MDSTLIAKKLRRINGCAPARVILSKLKLHLQIPVVLNIIMEQPKERGKTSKEACAIARSNTPRGCQTKHCDCAERNDCKKK